MSITGKMKVNRAFTLIEILLVVIIMGIVFATAAPNFFHGYSRFQLNKTADDLLTISRWAQAMAIGQERIYALFFSDDRRSYHLMRAVDNEITDDQETFEPVSGSLGFMHRVPDTIKIDSHEDRIEFHPDGTIDPAVIELNSPEQKMVLSSAAMRGMMTKVDDE